MVWGVKGPGQVEGREAGKPGSPDPRIPGSQEAGKPRSRSQILDFKGRGKISKGYLNVTAWGEASKYLRVRGALPGGVTQHLRAHAQHTCCVTPPGSAPRTPKNTFMDLV